MARLGDLDLELDLAPSMRPRAPAPPRATSVLPAPAPLQAGSGRVPLAPPAVLPAASQAARPRYILVRPHGGVGVRKNRRRVSRMPSLDSAPPSLVPPYIHCRDSIRALRDATMGALTRAWKESRGKGGTAWQRVKTHRTHAGGWTGMQNAFSG
ncbi:hypothetical protein JB92DRAFT_3114284 [Gautieria morchelliformis]|nr:hypothetical protein JB92DRAFT_3114284 [Gautieria morchelliformis]